MRSRASILVLAFIIWQTIGSSLAEDPVRLPPVKLDKNLRRALLKALADLDTESAEQKSATETRDANTDIIDFTSTSDESQSNNDRQAKQSLRGSIFSFDGFPSDEETPSEDKLQNSTYVEIDKYLGTDDATRTTEKSLENNGNNESNEKAFQAHDVIIPDKSSAIYEKSSEIVYDNPETRSVKSSSSSSSSNSIVDITSVKSSGISYSESLAGSSSNGIATANALVSPSPTASSPIAPDTAKNATKSSKVIKDEQEVKIFQAPLVAAFTVQQDERGVAKSVVPIYHPTGDGEALTLQEQLEFKQQLLERQLAELQAQQIQQTQFLVRQRQIYEQQLRQKQQQQLFIQEQSRVKQLQEEQRNYQLQQQKQQQQQQQLQQQQQQFAQSQQSGLLALQLPFKTSGVNVQPSLTLELPKSALAPAFHQPNYQEQLRIQQRQQQLQQQANQQARLLAQQQLQQQRQQQLLQQQQRLQQSFSAFPLELQPPNSGSALRFNRQEAFGAVGNFGFNDGRQQQQQQQPQQQQQQSIGNRNHFGYNNQLLTRGLQTFSYNPYHNQQLSQQQYRQQRPQTPAKQIQNLLFQSGVVGDLGTPKNNGGGQEDLNIVSKVLALNVGALPTKNLRYNNFGNSVNNALANPEKLLAMGQDIFEDSTLAPSINYSKNQNKK